MSPGRAIARPLRRIRASFAFEKILESARLLGAYIINESPGIDRNSGTLREREAEKQSDAVEKGCCLDSLSEREKAAVVLSEAISSYVFCTPPGIILQEARRYFAKDQLVRALTIVGESRIDFGIANGLPSPLHGQRECSK